MHTSHNISESFTKRLSRVIPVLAVLLALAGWQATAPISYGQIQEWSQPILLAPRDAFGWFPDIAVDSTGQVHVVWSSGAEGYDTVMYTTSKNGQEWSDLTDIMALVSGGEVTRPALLIDQQGTLHMSFRETSVYYSHAPVDSARSATAWLPPDLLSTSQVAYFSRLALDGHGKLHLVFTENVISPECPICYHVFYRRSDDNGFNWSTPLDISNLPTGSAKPQVLIDKQDYIHVVWEAGRGGSYGQLVDPTQVMYAASYDGGNTWTSPIELNTLDGSGKNIAIGLDGEGTLIVVWWDLPEDVVYYRTSPDQGRSWSQPQPIPDIWGTWAVYQSRLDDYSMATDSAGDVHLVLVGRTARDQRSLSVLHAAWNGSTWSGPESISTLMGDVPEWPRIAIGLGNQLHVTWFVRDQAHIFDTENGKYQVWYSRGTSAAPATPPLPAWPTLTPTPAARVVTLPTATPTLAPVVAPEPPHVSSESLYTEAGSMIVLAKSLLPVLLLVAALAIALSIRRR
jgi:hypothetical protein